MKKLTVLYDAQCGICRRCRDWLRRQTAVIPMDFLALQSKEVDRRFPGARRFHPERELIAIDDRGAVYRGERAWILCLWALKGYRPLARQLARPALRPLAWRICRAVSGNRHRLSRWMGENCEGGCHV